MQLQATTIFALPYLSTISGRFAELAGVAALGADLIEELGLLGAETCDPEFDEAGWLGVVGVCAIAEPDGLDTGAIAEPEDADGLEPDDACEAGDTDGAPAELAGALFGVSRTTTFAGTPFIVEGDPDTCGEPVVV